APGTAVAGVFTRSKTAAAPVDWCRNILGNGTARALVVNSGNANAFTGYAGARAVTAVTASAALAAGCRADEVYVGSTGVIGEPLPAERITALIPGLYEALAEDAWEAAANAIRTTDTFAKGASRGYSIGGERFVLTGIAKGSGMIAPDMGTMLAYLFTDAKLPAGALQTLLVKANETSFNAITVDGDTSTSDTVLLFATGQGARHDDVRHAGDPLLRDFRKALGDVMTDLAHQIVRDGEGASKFVTVRVTGAQSKRAARVIAMAISNSPLVKTAIAGEDPNWGRIVMAVGKAGEKANRDALSIRFGHILVAENGEAAPGYVEQDAAQYMKQPEIEISVDVGVGRGRFTAWTCDLTARYISINADYRT
ncbi:MAG: bifunctional glutamate N-acetyltransferase/amino-acid acetyltransferase ArgJ, partial [Proteobacteria bacterium]|nr:bifunctional glutamate N-acetyltransferase/amino-acid acetyltransferase ArgJ [Pseudomonadota bacterium]